MSENSYRSLVQLWFYIEDYLNNSVLPNKAGLKCRSVRTHGPTSQISLKSNLWTYVRASIRPQKVSSISLKFGL